jgi:hypothetical protein
MEASVFFSALPHSIMFFGKSQGILLKMKGKFRLNLKKVWGIIGMERYKKLMGKVLEQNGRKRHCGEVF